MKTEIRIYYDSDNLISISKAEQKVSRLVNNGFSLKETIQTGFNSWLLIYGV